MRKTKKQIGVFSRKETTRDCLEKFFRSRSQWQCSFFSKKEEFKRVLSKKEIDLAIIEADDIIEELINTSSDIPSIALITEHIPMGFRKVLKCDMDCCLIAPFDEDSLEYKIKTLLNGENYLNRLLEENRELEALLEISFLITSTLEPKELLFFIVKKVAEAIRPDRCSILSLSYGSPRYAYVVSTFESKEITNLKLDLRKYPEIKEAFKKKAPVIIKDALRDPIMQPVLEIIKPIGIRSIAVVPIIHRDEVIGAFFLRTSKKNNALREKEIRFCQSVANLSANALYNAMIFEKLNDENERLKKMAITDYLTGIYNIRYFYHRLEEEFSRAQRYKHPLACVMMDIDHFKSVNDRYGHRAGDRVLREFAQLVKRHTRKSDVFARYGGEEFILLLPHTDLEGAEKEALRLRQFIKEYKFKGLEGQRITASFGLACWPVHKITSPDDLINCADQALYMAKEQGRDRVVVFNQYE